MTLRIPHQHILIEKRQVSYNKQVIKDLITMVRWLEIISMGILMQKLKVLYKVITNPCG